MGNEITNETLKWKFSFYKLPFITSHHLEIKSNLGISLFKSAKRDFHKQDKGGFISEWNL